MSKGLTIIRPQKTYELFLPTNEGQSHFLQMPSCRARSFCNQWQKINESQTLFFVHDIVHVISQNAQTFQQLTSPFLTEGRYAEWSKVEKL